MRSRGKKSFGIKLKNRDAENTAAASFLPVEVQLPATPIEIVFSQGTTVRVGNGCDRTTLETVLAALEQRAFEKVIGWNLHPEMLPNIAGVAAEAGLPFEAVDLPGLRDADVIITITSSFASSLMADHVSPGTHLACMGTDTKGKQEVEAALLGRAAVFCDEVAQSITIGEAQHAVAQGLIDAQAVTPIGAVINGTHTGRAAAEAITLFDGTGVGLQDLAVADAIVDAALAQGMATIVPL